MQRILASGVFYRRFKQTTALLIKLWLADGWLGGDDYCGYNLMNNNSWFACMLARRNAVDGDYKYCIVLKQTRTFLCKTSSFCCFEKKKNRH